MGGRAAVDSLLATAASGSFFRTFPAIGVLGRSGDPRVLEPLSRLLENPVYACQSLGKLKDASASDEIVALMSHPAGQVRVAAVEALAHLGTDRANGALRDAARSSDPDVQRASSAGTSSSTSARGRPATSPRASLRRSRRVAGSSSAPRSRS